MSHVYVVVQRPVTCEDFCDDDDSVDSITSESTDFTILSVCNEILQAQKAFSASSPNQGELIALYEVPLNRTDFVFQTLLDKKFWTKEKSEYASDVKE